MRVDAHHHLWLYNEAEYVWIDDRMALLRRHFLPADLHCELRKAGVEATVAVQARQTLEETHWLLDLAAKNSFLQGVVGWAPISSDQFPSILAELSQKELLKGLRHIVQAEKEGFLDGKDFNRGISKLKDTGLVYDLLIYARQLEEAVRFVGRHPDQIFVLDHIAKPDIAMNGYLVWKHSLQELAKHENVVCKLSGMVTEADWHSWTVELLFPYFETVLEAFGPSRLMIGTDWPVLNVASTYQQWWKIVTDWIAPLSVDERKEIEGGVAARVYRFYSVSSRQVK